METQLNTILIVDDTPKNLQVLGNTLKQENYKIEFAIDGKSALDWLTKKDFDIILLDVMMPDMDGYEVCEKIRKGKIQQNIPIIFLTARTDTESTVKGFELGAQDYITKPFNTPELLARVKTQIELKVSREKLQSVNEWLESEVEKRTFELKGANIELEKINKELSVLDNSKTEFLRMISHEIRTPLNGIMGILYLLKGMAESNEMAALINGLDSSVNRLEKFSLMALHITSLRTGKYELKTTDIKIRDLFEFSLLNLSESISEKKITIKIDDSLNDIVINGDYDLLIMAFSKVLTNSVTHSPANGLIKITLNSDGEKYSIEISDNGKGFKKEVLEMKFEPFSTGSEHIDKNMGVDLALVKLIIDAHKGEIILKNSERGGAIVMIQLKVLT